MISSSIYSPLPTPTSIRVLSITPIEPSSSTSPEEDSITYTLQIVDLSDSPKFRALSYTWGEPYRKISNEKDIEHPPLFNRRIILDGIPVIITKNLFGALESFRNLGITGYLWVDAVCINQADLEERSAQVQLMCKIYSICHEVLAWLGPYKEGFQDLNWMATTFLQSFESARDDLSNPLVLTYSSFKDPAFWRRLGQNDGFERTVKAALFYGSCRYFSRAWIFQEMVLARRSDQGNMFYEQFRHLRMICGSFEINVPTLMTASNILVEYNWFRYIASEVSNLHDVEFEWLFEIVILCNIPEKKTGISSTTEWGPTWITFLTTLLVTTKSLACFDPRDKIYSMLGVLESIHGPVAESKGLHADYTQDYKTLFKQLTKLAVEDAGFLDFLIDTRRHGENHNPDSELYPLVKHHDGKITPSWVMNYLPLEVTNSLTPLGLQTFHAPLCEQRMFPKFEIIGDGIYCYGAYFDTLTKVNWKCDLEIDRYKDPTQLSFLSFYLSTPHEMNGRSRFDTFSNTLLINPSPISGEYRTQMECESLASTWFKTLLLHHYAAAVHSDAKNPSTGFAENQLCELINQLIFETDGKTWGQETLEMVKIAKDRGGNVPLAIDRLRVSIQDNMGYDKHEILANSFWRTAFATKRGLLGLGLSWLQEGDEVWLLTDAHIPFVLRPTGVKDKFTVVGGCYMYGFMNGEMLEDKWGVKDNIRPITLV